VIYVTQIIHFTEKSLAFREILKDKSVEKIRIENDVDPRVFKLFLDFLLNGSFESLPSEEDEKLVDDLIVKYDVVVDRKMMRCEKMENSIKEMLLSLDESKRLAYVTENVSLLDIVDQVDDLKDTFSTKLNTMLQFIKKIKNEKYEILAQINKIYKENGDLKSENKAKARELSCLRPKLKQIADNADKLRKNLICRLNDSDYREKLLKMELAEKVDQCEQLKKELSVTNEKWSDEIKSLHLKCARLNSDFDVKYNSEMKALIKEHEITKSTFDIERRRLLKQLSEAQSIEKGQKNIIFVSK
jgi:predicted RNase H-like nuclease (RuvC/YqgF family)